MQWDGGWGGGVYDRYVDITANRRNLPANKHLVGRGWSGGGGGGGQLTRESYMSALRAESYMSALRAGGQRADRSGPGTFIASFKGSLRRDLQCTALILDIA